MKYIANRKLLKKNNALHLLLKCICFKNYHYYWSKSYKMVLNKKASKIILTNKIKEFKIKKDKEMNSKAIRYKRIKTK